MFLGCALSYRLETQSLYGNKFSRNQYQTMLTQYLIIITYTLDNRPDKTVHLAWCGQDRKEHFL